MPDTFLRAVRINRVMRAIDDKRLLPSPLVWINRIPIVRALEGEILLRWTGRVLIADLITDDAQAVTYTSGKATTESYAVPKIKHGAAFTESMIRQLRALQQAGTLSGDGGFFLRREAQVLEALRTGIYQRIEEMLIAMLLDTYSYDRYGIKITGASWGTPADLKVTPTYAWTDAVNATPVTDLQTLLRRARVRYGIRYNRLSMSRQGFDYMIATAEYQAKAKILLPNGISFSNLILQATEDQVAFAEKVLGGQRNPLMIELRDDRYWQQAPEGTEASANYHPINKVILTDTANDNDATAWDFARGELIEPVVAQILGVGNFAGMGGQVFGPIGYATGNEHLNPPDLQYWGADRGFPRKHLLQASAVLTIGSFTDSIDVGPPF